MFMVATRFGWSAGLQSRAVFDALCLHTNAWVMYDVYL